MPRLSMAKRNGDDLTWPACIAWIVLDANGGMVRYRHGWATAAAIEAKRQAPRFAIYVAREDVMDEVIDKGYAKTAGTDERGRARLVPVIRYAL